jgi:heme oxygenase (mycobilin-producing)
MTTASARVRVLVWYRAADQDQITSAYRQVTAELAGTPGLLSSELIRSAADQESYAVLSEWQSLAALRSWESGRGHAQAPAALRLLSDRDRPGGSFGVYQVI